MSKKQKLTPWFPADVKPVRPGVYEKDFERKPREYQYWDGNAWYYGHGTPEEAAASFRPGYGANAPYPRPWRGLAKEPK